MINSKELLGYTQNLSLLFVEDHDDLRINTTEILKNFFLKVDSVEDGAKGLEYYKKSFYENSCYDIVITDIQMPKLDGVSLTKEIYALNEEQTVVVLSAYDESNYLLPLINLGIEQFIKKPIDYQELLKVLLNISKKISQKNPDVAPPIQPITSFDEKSFFNRETKMLFRNDEKIYLTKYEIMFLELLTTQIGKIFSNEEIVAYFTKSQENIDPQNIRKLVSKLRKKLPSDKLESIYGVGYRLVPFF